jgi:hypothetical protein
MRTRALAVVIFLVALAAAFAAVRTGHGFHPLFGFSSGA